MIKAPRLRTGDTIGLIAPSSPTKDKYIKQGVKKLREMGFQVKIGKTAYSKLGYLAGPDELRADELNSFFKDKNIDGIICLRGGYGSPRILNLLDYDMIRENPKVFVGYSDITALHIALNQLADLVTFHGPMLASDISGDFSEFSRNSLLNAIFNREFKSEIENSSREIKSIKPGLAEGPIIGGNLSLIVSSLGTPYEIDTRGKILLIEEIGEATYRIDRMLNQLILSNKFQDAKGIIFGDFNNCLPEEDGDFTVEELIEDMIKPLNKPTITGLEIGHCEPAITLPLGLNTRLDAGEGAISILEESTI